MTTDGEIAFNAFHTAILSPTDRRPEFLAMPSLIQEAWEAAAKAVRQQCEADEGYLIKYKADRTPDHG